MGLVNHLRTGSIHDSLHVALGILADRITSTDSAYLCVNGLTEWKDTYSLEIHDVYLLKPWVVIQVDRPFASDGCSALSNCPK